MAVTPEMIGLVMAALCAIGGAVALVGPGYRRWVNIMDEFDGKHVWRGDGPDLSIPARLGRLERKMDEVLERLDRLAGRDRKDQ